MKEVNSIKNISDILSWNYFIEVDWLTHQGDMLVFENIRNFVTVSFTENKPLRIFYWTKEEVHPWRRNDTQHFKLKISTLNKILINSNIEPDKFFNDCFLLYKKEVYEYLSEQIISNILIPIASISLDKKDILNAKKYLNVL